VTVSAQPVSPARVAAAWGVHALTASGAVVGAVALVAIASGDLARAALLLLVGFVIDSVDGTLARRVGVARVLPQVDGRRLDDMVDYLNYVIVPAVFLVAAGSILHWGWAALLVLASAYGFAQTEAKTEDDFFLGWPSYWNVVALYLWLLDISPLAGTAWICLFSVLIFVPIKYVYLSRMRVLRRSTNALAGVWVLALAAAVIWPDRTRAFRLVEISLAFPAWYLILSLWLGGVRERAARAPHP
jgi:phosphatidylcholine synthase